MHYSQLNQSLGNIDLYLLDGILKGYFDNKQSLLDAGCGEGRNIKYFAENGFHIKGIDSDPMAIKMARMIYKTVVQASFEHRSIEELTDIEQYDAIVVSAVLHFANDQDHFDQQMTILSTALKPGGTMFIRMATDAGVTHERHHFTYVLRAQNASHIWSRYGLTLMEPWKSVVVEGKRSMGVFFLSKT